MKIQLFKEPESEHSYQWITNGIKGRVWFSEETLVYGEYNPGWRASCACFLVEGRSLQKVLTDLSTISKREISETSRELDFDDNDWIAEEGETGEGEQVSIAEVEAAIVSAYGGWDVIDRKIKENEERKLKAEEDRRRMVEDAQLEILLFQDSEGEHSYEWIANGVKGFVCFEEVNDEGNYNSGWWALCRSCCHEARSLRQVVTELSIDVKREDSFAAQFEKATADMNPDRDDSRWIAAEGEMAEGIQVSIDEAEAAVVSAFGSWEDMDRKAREEKERRERMLEEAREKFVSEGFRLS